MPPSTRRRSRKLAVRRKLKKGLVEFLILTLVVCAVSFILALMFSSVEFSLSSSDVTRQQFEKALEEVKN